MSDELLKLIVTGLLSGGAFAAVAAIITSRSAAKKGAAEVGAINAKLPAEVDSVVVQGAESAVLVMQAALDSATKRIAQLERERESDRERIRELEAKVTQLEAKVQRAERALGDAREAGAALRQELEDFVAEQRRRK